MASTGEEDLPSILNPPEDTEGQPEYTVGSKINGSDEAGNKFQQAIASWRNVNLTKLVPSLDSVATELVEHQKATVAERKTLAQKTKDFRKLDDAGKVGEIKALLKSYQNFIDLVTNQSKTVQSAFFQAYTPLSEAPDPYPLLEASIDSLVTVEETVPKLKQENEHLQKTVAKLTTQVDESEKQLEHERSNRQTNEAGQDDKVKEIEASWSAVLKEKEDNWAAKESALEEKVEGQDRLLKELKASYEVNHRLGKGESEGQEAARSNAVSAELEIVSSELERTSQRLAEVEARNESMRVELAQAKSSQSAQTNVEDDPAFLRLRSENSSLLRKLDSSRFEKESEKGSLESKLRSVERDLTSLKSDRDNLREKVSKWSDYEDIKQELDVLKTIEFATGDDDEDETTQANGGVKGSKEDTLEKMLLARNKKLTDDMTLLRVAHKDLQERLETLQEELSIANMDLEKSRTLNETLENDLSQMQQEASNVFPPAAPSVAGTYVSRYPRSSRHGGRSNSPTSSIISGFDPARGGSPGTLETLRANEGVGGGSGILPMVTAQRDRFKKRIAELEGELSKNYQEVSSLRGEVAALQKDNLSLYEKTRYVSTYNRGGPSSSGQAFAMNPNPSTIQIGGGSEDRYRSAYETNISPFASFRRSENIRAMRRMTLPERVVFQITRLVLATRTSRNLFAAYCLALHLLVFWMLSGAGTTSVSLATEAAGAAGLAGRKGGSDGAAWRESKEFDSGD